MKKTEGSVKEILQPYRNSIDELDKKIVSLLAERFKIVEQVAEVKDKYDINLVQSDRVAEVCKKNANMAEEQGLNGEFVYNLYMMMIDYAHVLEGELMGRNE